MKQFIIIFLALPLVFGIWTVTFNNEPGIIDGTEVTSSVVIADRAMSDGMPYLSVELSDGNTLCPWDPSGDVIPDSVSIGDTLEVTYGKQEGFDRYILINVKMGTA